MSAKSRARQKRPWSEEDRSVYQESRRRKKFSGKIKVRYSQPIEVPISIDPDILE